jgi:hypothetical protein
MQQFMGRFVWAARVLSGRVGAREKKRRDCRPEWEKKRGAAGPGEKCGAHEVRTVRYESAARGAGRAGSDASYAGQTV